MSPKEYVNSLSPTDEIKAARLRAVADVYAQALTSEPFNTPLERARLAREAAQDFVNLVTRG